MAQRESILLKLRELIMNGELGAGQRVAELPVAERLGVSRTPVRQALAVLAKEGLLVESASRGYVVRAFTLKHILDAIQLRGVLEGMAARLVAETGMTRAVARRMEAYVEEGEAIIRSGRPIDDGAWSELNGRFHGTLMLAADNEALANALSLNDKVPFAAAPALLGRETRDAALLERHSEIIVQAQSHHRAVVDALQQRQGARAEALMREHALIAWQNLTLTRPAAPALAEGSVWPLPRAVG